MTKNTGAHTHTHTHIWMHMQPYCTDYCLNNYNFSDVRFSIGEERQVVYAHKCILAARLGSFSIAGYIYISLSVDVKCFVLC